MISREGDFSRSHPRLEGVNRGSIPTAPGGTAGTMSDLRRSRAAGGVERKGNDERLARVASVMSTEELLRLVDEAGFVFRGKAVPNRPTHAEINSEGTDKTVTVEVQEILRGTDVLRGLVGRDVTVVSEEAAAIARADALVFFTNCASLGEHVVAREVGHREASHESVREIAQTLRMAAERPLAERVAGADLIVTGEVADAGPLEKSFPPRSEHDPDWWIARVTVRSAIKGRKPQRGIQVLFANSLDIAWYKSPKLHEGASGIFILRSRREDEAPADVQGTVYQATDPLDFLPAERLPEVERALEQDRGDR